MALRNLHHCMHRLRGLLVVLAVGLVAAPSTPLAGAATTSDDQGQRTDPPITRFSDLAEVTTTNVSGLMPLMAQSVAAMRADPLPDSSAAIDALDLSLQRFVEERTSRIDLPARAGTRAPQPGLKRVVSYLVAAGDGERTPLSSARADLARRELRAWDPIERHVLWSVHEALPISSGALVTAGGLVFYGTGDGWLKALDARTGRVLWKHRVDGGRKLDAPVSYRGADGHQYIAVRALAPAVADTPHEGSATVLLFALAH